MLTLSGIGFSDDPLLQGRNFSYFDTQLSRLGVNWQEIPINRPVCPVMNFHRDGQKRHTITPGKINYWPNRHSAAPPTPASEGGYYEYPEKVVGRKQRLHSVKFSEHYNQAQLFYNSMSAIEKQHIISAISFELDHCEESVVYERVITRLTDIDIELARAVATTVGGPMPDKPGRPNHGKKAKGLSQMDFTPEALGLPLTIATRQIAILIADGFNYAEYEAVKGALSAVGALCFTIGPKRQAVKSSTGQSVQPDHHFEGQRSTMYDALYVPSGTHIPTLAKNGRVIHYIREAFGHCKAIGATGDGVELIRKACDVQGMHFASGTGVTDSYGVVTAAAGLADMGSSIKESLKIVKSTTSFIDAFVWNISQHRNFARELDGLTTMIAF